MLIIVISIFSGLQRGISLNGLQQRISLNGLVSTSVLYGPSFDNSCLAIEQRDQTAVDVWRLDDF